MANEKGQSGVKPTETLRPNSKADEALSTNEDEFTISSLAKIGISIKEEVQNTNHFLRNANDILNTHLSDIGIKTDSILSVIKESFLHSAEKTQKKEEASSFQDKVEPIQIAGFSTRALEDLKSVFFRGRGDSLMMREGTDTPEQGGGFWGGFLSMLGLGRFIGGGAIITGVLRPVAPFLRRLPIIGGFFEFYNAFNAFEEGSVQEGIFSILAGLTYFIPKAGLVLGPLASLIMDDYRTDIKSGDRSMLENITARITDWMKERGGFVGLLAKIGDNFGCGNFEEAFQDLTTLLPGVGVIRELLDPNFESTADTDLMYRGNKLLEKVGHWVGDLFLSTIEGMVNWIFNSGMPGSETISNFIADKFGFQTRTDKDDRGRGPIERLLLGEDDNPFEIFFGWASGVTREAERLERLAEEEEERRRMRDKHGIVPEGEVHRLEDFPLPPIDQFYKDRRDQPIEKTHADAYAKFGESALRRRFGDQHPQMERILESAENIRSNSTINITHYHYFGGTESAVPGFRHGEALE